MRADQVAARRMRNSRFTGPRFTRPDAVAAWHGAMQGQDYGQAKWSIGQRAEGLVDADVDQALAAGSIVRTHVLRPTWHLVARQDLRWLLALTGPRVQGRNTRRHRELGLDARVLARSERVIASALEGGGRMTRDEIGAVLAGAGIDPSGQRRPYVLMHCELEAVICRAGSAASSTRSPSSTSGCRPIVRGSTATSLWWSSRDGTWRATVRPPRWTWDGGRA